MAAALKGAFGVEAELIEGSGGIFDVAVDNDVIFSKKKEGRFPTDEEIINLIRKS